MKIATWNIRGFHHPLKQNGVRDWLKKDDLDILEVLPQVIHISLTCKVR